MKKILALLMALVMIFALCACGKSAPAANDGKLVVGTSADYAPLEFMYKNDKGEMVYGGFDLAVADFIAKDMGKEMQVENMNFDYLLVALQKGDYDIVIAGLEVTEERLQAADFSDPYYTGENPTILVRAEDAGKYKTLSDFNGKIVGAQAATTKADQVTECIPEATLQTLVNVQDLVNELVYGKIDAVLLDGDVAMSYVDQNKDLAASEASGELPTQEPYCIAVAKGDPKGILPGINAAIAKMTKDQINDWFAEAQSYVDLGNYEEVSVDAPEA